jgi:hypothetical protein
LLLQLQVLLVRLLGVLTDPAAPLPRRCALACLQGSVLQCGLILGSSILFWAFRSGESDSGYGYISH